MCCHYARRVLSWSITSLCDIIGGWLIFEMLNKHKVRNHKIFFHFWELIERLETLIIVVE